MVTKYHLYSLCGADEITKFLIDRKVDGTLDSIDLPWPNDYNNVDEDEYYSVEYEEHFIKMGRSKDYKRVIEGLCYDKKVSDKILKHKKEFKLVIEKMRKSVMEEKLGYITILLSLMKKDFTTIVEEESKKIIGTKLKSKRWRSEKILKALRFY
jgi:hypothetical protein